MGWRLEGRVEAGEWSRASREDVARAGALGMEKMQGRGNVASSGQNVGPLVFVLVPEVTVGHCEV